MEILDHVEKKPKHLDGDDSPSSLSSSSSSSSRSLREFDTNEKADHSSVKPPEPPVSPPDAAPVENSTPPMKSPPVQTMGHPPGYDPNRIPASIFSTKPANQGEWSVNSNESLFSIHMGNNSFSRDYSILFGKSGELPRLDDWSTTQNSTNNNNNNLRNNNELSSSLPPVMEVPSHEEHSGELSKTPRKDEKKSSDNVILPVKTDNHADNDHHSVMKKPVRHVEVVDPPPQVKKGPPQAESNVNRSSSSNLMTMPSPPRFSDESGNSGSSFAFPVLVNDGVKTSSLKSVPENPRSPRAASSAAEEEDHKEHTTTPNKLMDTRWYSSCFSCWPRTWCM